MLRHPQEVIKITHTAAILQLNCRRAPSVMNSLINDENTTNFSFLAIQEPPINPRTNSPFEHSGWLLVVTTPGDMLEASRPRSCIYINSQANINIQPIHSTSRDISGYTARIQDLEMLLLNVYNQPATLDGFEAMDKLFLLSLSHSSNSLP